MGEAAEASGQGTATGAVTLRARIESERAATLAAMESGSETDDAAATATKAVATDDTKGAATADEGDADASTAGDDADDSDAKADDADKDKAAKSDDDDDDDAPDADTAKRIAAVQKATKRERELIAKQRDEVAKSRAEVAAERHALQAERAELEQWKQLKARAKVDPLALAKAAGISEDDYEHLAKVLYAHRKGAEPKDKEAALRMQRERETTDEVAALRKELDNHKAELAKQRETAQLEAAWNNHISDVAKAAKVPAAEAPLLRAQLEKNPGRAHAAIREITMALTQETGELPDAADVIARYEQVRRAELEDLGIDVAAFTKKSPATKTDQRTAATTKTLGTNMRAGTTVNGNAKRSVKEEREETRKLLESGKLD